MNVHYSTANVASKEVYLSQF